ncbi:MAG: hypothetical protein M1812_007409 [Candelaria pacifica]|nr:MAG: hypothetical protein M1812_007409 [Candelaria pacifica]
MVLRELWPARQDNYSLDIVAVHGLEEDHITAWVDLKSQTLWLRDLLPQYIPQARILTYGYPVGGPSSWEASSERILQHAQTLVAELEADRLTANAVRKPIIFICHGVGGIVVKKALAYSSSRVAKNVAHLYSIFISTYGLLFLGTPHEGIEKTSWSASAQRNAETTATPDALLAAVGKGSETLQSINDQFAPLTKQYHIHFFWEQKETTTATGVRYVVEERSAAPIWADTERSGIWADHSQMCKFESMEASGFSVVRATLQRYAEGANDTVSQRWIQAIDFLTRLRTSEATELVGFDIYNNSKPFTYMKSNNTQRNKHFHVPYNASSIFTGRADISKRLEDSILSRPGTEDTSMQKRFVLYGLGGSGKTQFCLKFIQDHRQNFWGIFWIDASSTKNAEEGFSKIAQIDGSGQSCDDGKHWLTSLEVSWMLVIDNADDPSIDVSRFFPSGDRGHILVTSRNKECRYHQTVGSEELKEMDHEEAITLLLRAAGKDFTDQKFRDLAQPIAKTLGYLPLALDQAGATIRQDICTLKSYLPLYHRHRRQIMGTRSVQGGEQYRFTVYSTWEVSFQMIKKLDKPAAIDACEILQLFSFFHFQQVPARMLQKAWENSAQSRTASPAKSILSRLLNNLRRSSPQRTPLQLLRITNQGGRSWDMIRLQSALSILAQFSLLTLDAENEEDITPTGEAFTARGKYSMHPLVHFWARDRLDRIDQRIWFNIAATTLADSIDLTTEATEHAYRRSLIPHIDALVAGEHAEPLVDSETTDKGLQRAFKLARVYHEGGRWKDARDLQEKVVDARTSRLGLEDSETLEAMTSLGETYWNSGLNDKAADMQRQVLDTTIRLRGPEHAETLSAMDKLADTYWLCGLMADAEELGVKAMDGMESTFGPLDIRTLTAMLNLARVYNHTDHSDRALQLQCRVRAICEENYDLEHPLTLRAKMEVGMSYNNLGRYDDAEMLLQDVLRARERVFGEDHAYTLWAANDLSKVYCAQGRSKEAEVLLTSVLEMAIRTLGRDHVGTRMTMSNVARAYSGQGRWIEAGAMLYELNNLILRKIKIGEIDELHPDRMAVLNGLGRNYLQQGRLVEAENLLVEALQLTERKLGPENPRTIKLKSQLAKLQKSSSVPAAVADSKSQIPMSSKTKSSTW